MFVISLAAFLVTFSEPVFCKDLISVSTAQSYSVVEVAESINPGTIVILGETHATNGTQNLDQQNQVDFISALQAKYQNVHVGMEFINYTLQDQVDQYLDGDLTDDEFKSNIGWGGSPFESYKEQILAPLFRMGWTHALNAPRSLTRAIARNGLSELTESERALMPPNFSLGSEIYRKRFYEVMGDFHDNDAPEYVKNMFAAQCTWDDTMAWQATEKVKVNPLQIMVIIVGNFHARYGGGLADRLRARGHSEIVTIVQVASEGLSDSEIEGLIKPHPVYGTVSDYIW